MIILDSSFNPKDTSFEHEALTSIRGQIKNSLNKPILYTTINLYSSNKIIWGTAVIDREFYKTLAPGNYTLTVSAIGYKWFSYNFSIGYHTTIHFNINLAKDYSLTVYDIHSKIELTKEQIDKIKACAVNNNDLYKCSNRNVYWVMIDL